MINGGGNMARNKYPEETRNLIIDTAARLFTEKGYEHTSIQDIIDHLGGLSKGAIYYHFKSKEEIMNAVADRMYSPSNQKLYQICKRTDLNGLEKLKEIFRTSAFNPAHKNMFVAAPDMMKNPQLLRLLLNETQTESVDMVQKILEEGIADGSIHTEFPRELAEVLMLVSNVWLNPMIYHSSLEETVHKLKFYQYTLKLWGLDILDDEVIASLEGYTVLYNQKKGEEE